MKKNYEFSKYITEADETYVTQITEYIRERFNPFENGIVNIVTKTQASIELSDLLTQCLTDNIFDLCDESIIKGSERSRRSKMSGPYTTGSRLDQPLPAEFDKFWSVCSNKVSFNNSLSIG